MKIHELISRLHKIADEHGDVECRVFDSFDWEYQPIATLDIDHPAYVQLNPLEPRLRPKEET